MTRSETTPLNDCGGLTVAPRKGSSRWSNANPHNYASVAVFEVEPSGAGGSLPAERKSMLSTRRRAIGAVGILLAFGFAVMALQQREQQKKQESRHFGNTYRGVLQQVVQVLQQVVQEQLDEFISFLRG